MQYNNVKPQTKLEAIKWNYFNSDKWDFIQIRYWPHDIARAVMRRGLNYVMRFRWFLYLVGNGMDPSKARDVVKAELNSSPSNRAHVDALYRDLKKNAKKWSYWDEHIRKTMFIDDTYVGDNAVVPTRMVVPPLDYSLKADNKRREKYKGKTSIFDLLDQDDDDDVSDLE